MIDRNNQKQIQANRLAGFERISAIIWMIIAVLQKVLILKK